LLFGLVAQRQSSGLIIHWSKVRILPGPIESKPLPGPFCQEQGDFEPEFFKSVGRVLSKKGSNDKAMAYFSEALRLKPDFPEAYKNLVSAPARQKKLKDAAQP
jgi:tetratricopeptide (TPR) repeat protein